MLRLVEEFAQMKMLRVTHGCLLPRGAIAPPDLVLGQATAGRALPR